MTVHVAAVGDVMVDRENPDSIFEHVRELLHSADIVFGQLETAYSNKGSMGSSGPRGAMPNDVSNYPAIPNAGFDVISMASNHIMDWGADAVLDCRDRLEGDGIDVVGAGEDLSHAYQAVVESHSGVDIAFLSFCSVAPDGYYAATNKPGVAPMRAITHYEPVEPDQPGTPCEVLTIPRERDIERLEAKISEAQRRADVVIVSMHWGIHFIRSRIADYQTEVAEAAIEAGADAIVGHHPHILKGIDVQRGVPILYSIGNFAFDFTGRNGDEEYNERRQRVYDELVPTTENRFQSDARYSTIASLNVDEGGVTGVRLTPVWINKTDQPEPVSPDSDHGREMVEYLDAVTRQAGFETDLQVSDGDVVVRADLS